MTGNPIGLTRLATICSAIIKRAKEDLGSDLLGLSPLDLVADQLPDIPLRALQDALVVAGVSTKGNR
jgi:hypothetical protein